MDAFDSSLAIARRTGEVALEVRALPNYTMVDFWHLRWDETVANGLRVIELARRAADQLSEVSARFWVGQALLHIGDSEGSQPHAAAMLSTAEKLRDRYWLATAIWFNERVSIYKGDWQAAKHFNERRLLLSPSATRPLGTRILLKHESGNLNEGHEYLGRLVEVLRLVTPGPKFDYASAGQTILLLLASQARWTNYTSMIAPQQQCCQRHLQHRLSSDAPESVWV